jgi:hypothetical protein
MEVSVKQINGYTIIASAHMNDDSVVVLAARLDNYHSDDYSYVVATLDTPNGTSWPSGKYFRTLPIAVQTWDDEMLRHHRAELLAKSEGGQA